MANMTAAVTKPALAREGSAAFPLNNLTLQQCSARLLCFVRPKPPYMPVSVTTLKKKEVCLCRLDSRSVSCRERRAGVLPACRAPN